MPQISRREQKGRKNTTGGWEGGGGRERWGGGGKGRECGGEGGGGKEYGS